MHSRLPEHLPGSRFFSMMCFPENHQEISELKFLQATGKNCEESRLIAGSGRFYFTKISGARPAAWRARNMPSVFELQTASPEGASTMTPPSPPLSAGNSE